MEAELIRMRNSRFSTARFLGNDESLKELIENDRSVLLQNGITWEELADAIAGVISFCMHQPQFLGGHQVLATYIAMSENVSFRVSSVMHMGYQLCPFDKCVGHRAEFRGEGVGSMIAMIVKRVNSEIVDTMQLGSLLSHLCVEHQFLEGKECEFRVDPQIFIDFFELKKEKQINGTIGIDWFANKVKRDKLLVDHVLDPIPNIWKFYDGCGGIRYSS